MPAHSAYESSARVRLNSRRGWQTADKKPVKNQDLWERLESAVRSHRVKWAWIKGHSGHAENELADQLANRAIDEMLA